MHTPRLEYRNPRLGGLRSPGPWMLLIAIVLAGAILFNLSPKALVVVTAVGVGSIIVAGFVSSHQEERPQAPRKLARKQLLRAHRQLSSPRSPRPDISKSPPLGSERAAVAPSLVTNSAARPSPAWQRRRETSQAVLVCLFVSWATATWFLLSRLQDSLGPQWDQQSKGMSWGNWMILGLYLVSFVAFVPCASWIEGRIARYQRRRSTS